MKYQVRKMSGSGESRMHRVFECEDFDTALRIFGRCVIELRREISWIDSVLQSISDIREDSLKPAPVEYMVGMKSQDAIDYGDMSIWSITLITLERPYAAVELWRA